MTLRVEKLQELIKQEVDNLAAFDEKFAKSIAEHRLDKQRTQFDNNARKLADAENIDIRIYRVIYDAIGDVIEIFDGAIDSLRRFKDEVKEVAAGYECGISIVGFRNFSKGDIIEAYKMEEIKTSIANRLKLDMQWRGKQ